MAYEFKLPSLGEGVTGKVLDIMVNPGDAVQKDQIVMIIGTDKVDAEMPIDAEGTVEAILVKKGDDVVEGTAVMRLSGSAADAAPAAEVAATAAPTPTEIAAPVATATPPPAAPTTEVPANDQASSTMAYEFKLPSLGEGVTGKVLDIMVKSGEAVKKDQIVMIIGTDKVDAEMPIDADGTVDAILVKKGDDVNEGTVVLRLSGATASATAPAPVAPAVASAPAAATASSASPAPAALATEVTAVPAAPAVASAPAAATASAAGKQRISPLARKRAKELSVNLSDITPADGTGRISYKDVLDFVKKKIDTGGGSTTAAPGSAMAHKKLPNFEKFGSVERVPLTRIGQITADNMVYAFNAIPHAWISEKADITKLEELRQQYKDRVKAAGGSLTITAILTKALAAVLRKMPQFNTSFDPDKNEVIHKKFINIGIAVDTPRGLLVPVIKNADQKGLVDISIELTELSTRTRDNKNKPEDMEGGTFSVSNIGGIGGTNMLSIVNWPQTAIISITAASMEPHWNGTAFEPRLMMPMTIGWDHRVINGSDAARFLQELKNILEEPFLGWF